jgi:prophage regulatory protein
MPAPILSEANARSQLVRLPNVCAQTGLSRSNIYRRIAQGTFPPPIKIGPYTSAWSADEVARWVDARIAEHAKLAASRAESKTARA